MTYCSLIFVQDSYYHKIAAKMYYIRKRNVRVNGNCSLFSLLDVPHLLSFSPYLTLYGYISSYVSFYYYISNIFSFIPPYR